MDSREKSGVPSMSPVEDLQEMNNIIFARIIGLVGYIIQGAAFFGIPVYVFF